MSLPEVLLWRRVRPTLFDGPKIRHQHPIGRYVLDFYCDAAKLCIEVDGYAHGVGNNPKRDEIRDAWLAEQGIRTLRLPARLVLENMDSALATIRRELDLRPSPPLRGPPHPTGEDLATASSTASGATSYTERIPSLAYGKQLRPSGHILN